MVVGGFIKCLKNTGNGELSSTDRVRVVVGALIKCLKNWCFDKMFEKYREWACGCKIGLWLLL